MSNEDSESEPNPLTRPRFVISAVVVAALIVTGVVLAVVSQTGNDPDNEAHQSSPNTPTSPPPAEEESDSICGLKDGNDHDTLSEAPEATWKYMGETAYPTSSDYGPAESTDGYERCFQHSPEGAVFAAAYITTASLTYSQEHDEKGAEAWADYLMVGPGRDAVLNGESNDDDTSGRLMIQGFRVLDYSNDTAKIDLAARVTIDGESATASFVYDLVWENGDWKWEVPDTDDQFQSSIIPDLAGYVSWEPEG